MGVRPVVDAYPGANLNTNTQADINADCDTDYDCYAYTYTSADCGAEVFVGAASSHGDGWLP